MPRITNIQRRRTQSVPWKFAVEPTKKTVENGRLPGEQRVCREYDLRPGESISVTDEVADLPRTLALETMRKIKIERSV